MNTSDAILDLLQKQPSVCAEDLGAALLKTRANIQYHLKRMEKAGWIELVAAAAPQKGQGRPRHYYALSSRGRANNFPRLAAALLDRLFPQGLPAAERAARAAELAALLFRGDPNPTVKPFARQLNQLVKELTAQGYQARWEARAAGPVVVFRNCPYYDLLPGHPELCQVDAALLRLALKKGVTQQSKIQVPTLPACRFLIESEAQH